MISIPGEVISRDFENETILVVVTKTVRNGEEITTNNIKTSDLLDLLDTFRYELNKSIWFEIFLIIKINSVAVNGLIKKRMNFSNCLIQLRLVSCSWKLLLTNFHYQFFEIKYHFELYCDILSTTKLVILVICRGPRVIID